MKKVIKLSENDLRRIITRIIKENEEDWISQSQDIEGESDFGKIEVPKDLASNPTFKKLVSFFKRNQDAEEEIENEFDKSLDEDYDHFDYTDAQPKKISREEYWTRKLKNLGFSAAFGAIMGMFMAGGPDADTVIQMALAMAGGTAVVSNTLISTVSREKKKDYHFGKEDEQITEDYDEDYGTMRGRYFDDEEDDEEWGETDRGEEELQDLIEEARDFLENECGYDLHDINLMSEEDIVNALYDEENDELAEEIESLLYQEGFDNMPSYKTKWNMPKDSEEELGEGWDDFIQKKRYPKKYKPENYINIPKGFLRKHSGRMIDPEGTILTKSDEDPFDEYTDFDDEEYA